VLYDNIENIHGSLAHKIVTSIGEALYLDPSLWEISNV
jgi:hypothetical protein